MFCKTSVATMLLAICVSASASQAATKAPLVGAGSELCQTFLHKAGPSGLSDNAANQWVMGYLTGRATALPDSRHYPVVEPEAIMSSIASYCRATKWFKGIDIDAAAASFFITRNKAFRH